MRVSGSTVRLELPASSGYLVLARSAAAAMCAELNYPLDRLEDVKLAVDEGCSLMLSDTDADEVITLVLSPDEDGRLDISITATTRHGKAPKATSFAWTVLCALVDQVSATAAHGRLTISLQASRGDSLVTV
jgi:serine/threonine-protein kinase RsbW